MVIHTFFEFMIITAIFSSFSDFYGTALFQDRSCTLPLVGVTSDLHVSVLNSVELICFIVYCLVLLYYLLK